MVVQSIVTAAKNVPPPVARGLCVNCHDSQICRFPGYGGNIFFCEEHDSGIIAQWAPRCPKQSDTRA